MSFYKRLAKMAPQCLHGQGQVRVVNAERDFLGSGREGLYCWLSRPLLLFFPSSLCSDLPLLLFLFLLLTGFSTLVEAVIGGLQQVRTRQEIRKKARRQVIRGCCYGARGQSTWRSVSGMRDCISVRGINT